MKKIKQIGYLVALAASSYLTSVFTPQFGKAYSNFVEQKNHVQHLTDSLYSDPVYVKAQKEGADWRIMGSMHGDDLYHREILENGKSGWKHVPKSSMTDAEYRHNARKVFNKVETQQDKEAEVKAVLPPEEQKLSEYLGEFIVMTAKTGAAGAGAVVAFVCAAKSIYRREEGDEKIEAKKELGLNA